MKHHMICAILDHTPKSSLYHEMALYSLPVEAVEAIYLEVMA